MTARSLSRRGLAAIIILMPAIWMSARVLAQGPQLPLQAAPPAQVQFEGELEVLVEDGEASSRLLHFLRTRDQVLKLEFIGDPPGL